MKKKPFLLFLGILVGLFSTSYAQLSSLTDEFNGTSLDPSWTIFQGEHFENTLVNNGELNVTMNQNLCNFSNDCVWFHSETGGFIYKEVTGNFDLQTQVLAKKRSNPNADIDSQTQLAGLMVRDPDASSGENYVFNTVGYRLGNIRVEVKTTVNGSSSASERLTPDGTTNSELRITREGNVFSLYTRAIGSTDWGSPEITYTRSMPSTLQLGLVSHTFSSAPEILARFDYIRFNEFGTPPANTPPTVPTVSVIGKTQNSIDISWTASTDNSAVDHYNIYVDGIDVADVSNTLSSYSITGLNASQTYTINVSAVDDEGLESSLSANLVESTLTAPDTEAPSVPIGLSASNITATSLDLNWTVSSDNVGVTGYTIYRDGNSIASGITNNAYTDNTVAASTSNTYSVSASDLAGNESAQSSTINVTTSALNSGVMPFRVDAVIPVPNAVGVSTTTDLTIDLGGVVLADQQYANNTIPFRLFKLSDQDTSIFEYNFNTNGAGEWLGSDIIVFEIPDLEPNTEYIVLAGYGWVNSSIGGAGGFRIASESWGSPNREFWSFTTGDASPLQIAASVDEPVSFYPNPFQDNLTLELDQTVREVSIFDIFGNVVFSQIFSMIPEGGKTLNIDFTGIPIKGIYTLRVRTTQNVSSYTLLRE